ncbi:MAG: PD40 domain-containing protein [Chthonomonas sp.]|nr:PD40 domain-containing protein [Chthonomonas sp.]
MKLTTGFLLALGVAFAHANEPIVGARSLSLSPDGSQIAFSYLGDIWVAAAKGGRAIPLTSHVEMDDNPVWSRDGKSIAFASNRYGNFDIFVVDADGGRPQRVTYMSTNDAPTDFSPDNKSILFRGLRDKGKVSIYSVAIAGGKLKEYFTDIRDIRNPAFSPDGTKIVFQRNGFPFVRPRYNGSAGAEINVLDVATGKRTVVRNNGFQHLWTRFAGNDSLLTVTATEVTPSSRKYNEAFKPYTDNAKRTPNVYQVSLNGAAKARTSVVGGAGARYLAVSADGEWMAFEKDGSVFVGPADGSAEAKKVTFTVSADDKTTLEDRQIITNGATEMALSANNETVVFGLRNDLWEVPVKKVKGPNSDDANQLTTWAGIDGNAILSADGKQLFYLSDKSGAVNLWVIDMTTKAAKAVTSFAQDITNLRLMPKGTSLSFVGTGDHAGLHTYNIASGKIDKVIPVQPTAVFGDDTDYSWSPDERYIAYTDQINRSGYYFWQNASNIMVWDTTTKKATNVSRINAAEFGPTWSPDGKYLYFQSDRSGQGLYALPLASEEARVGELELKFEKPKETPKLSFDFEEAAKRVRRLIAGETTGVESDPENGDLVFIRAGDLWRAGYDGEGARPLTGGGGFSGFSFTRDNKQVYAVRSGGLAIINHRAPGAPQTNVGFRADWTRDIRVEREAAYQQFWRSYNRSFYDPHFHGRDWAEIGRRYRPLLSSVGHRNELATILGMMTGELESSHSEVSPAFAPGVRSASTAMMGVTFDYGFSGQGIRIAAIVPRSPASYKKSKLEAGEVITKVNGKPAELSEVFFRDVLNDQVARDLKLTVTGKDGKSRDVTLRSISGGEQNALMEEADLDAARKLVDKLSNGNVGYVYVAAMGEGDFGRFNQEYWEAIQGKKGMIIDCRGNNGGNISDRLIDMLERRPHSYYQNRGGEAFLAPGMAFDVPIVVMLDDASFSNGEMFPYATRQRGIAKLVGKRTPGYVIWTSGLPLVDGTSGRMPGSGVYRMDGTPIENNGQRPDYEVDLTPEQFFAGQDPQIAKAIDVLLGGKRG